MKTIIINEKQKGLLFKNGRYCGLLGAGKYHLFGGKEIEICELDDILVSEKCALETLLQDKDIASQVTVVEIGDQQRALHYVDGKFANIMPKGKYAFWSIFKKHEFQLVDMSTPVVDESVPEYIFSKISTAYYERVEVAEYEKAMIYFNQKLERILDAGVYYFWKSSVKFDVSIVDMRLTQMDVTGQEILTADKISLRINFVCNYRVTDCVRIFTEVDNYQEQLHVAAQLALREYVGRYRLDEILENKDKMSEYVFDRLKAKEKELFVEISDAGVKDIILPGEIRDIMNTVLVAEMAQRRMSSLVVRRSLRPDRCSIPQSLWMKTRRFTGSRSLSISSASVRMSATSRLMATAICLLSLRNCFATSTKPSTTRKIKSRRCCSPRFFAFDTLISQASFPRL